MGNKSMDGRGRNGSGDRRGQARQLHRKSIREQKKNRRRTHMGSGSGFLFASCDVMHPFAAVDAPKSDGGLCQVLDGDAQAEHLVRHLKDKAEQAHQRQLHAPEREVVDEQRGAHVAAAAQHTHDHRGRKAVEGHHARVAVHHDRAHRRRARREGEKRQHIRPEQRKQGQTLHAAEGEREEKCREAHGLADAHDALAAAARADLLADDDGGCVGDAVDAGGGEFVNAARHGVGGDEVAARGHVAHDDGDERVAHAPERFVRQHRRTVMHEAAQHLAARTEKGAPLERHGAAAQGVAEGERKFHHAREQRGGRRACDAERGEAELAEDEHIIAHGIAEHGRAEHQHTEARIFDAALHPNVDGREGIEDIREADDADIRRADRDETEIVRHQQQNIRREERHDEREERRDAAGNAQANADDAVDALAVAAAPVLADEHA